MFFRFYVAVLMVFFGFFVGFFFSGLFVVRVILGFVKVRCCLFLLIL